VLVGFFPPRSRKGILAFGLRTLLCTWLPRSCQTPGVGPCTSPNTPRRSSPTCGEKDLFTLVRYFPLCSPTVPLAEIRPPTFLSFAVFVPTSPLEMDPPVYELAPQVSGPRYNYTAPFPPPHFLSLGFWPLFPLAK